MKIIIKNMNNPDLLNMVNDELLKLGLNCMPVESGSAEIMGSISVNQLWHLNQAVGGSGLVMQECRKLELVEKIKEVIIEYVHIIIGQVNINFSDHLSTRLGYDYTYLANVFSKKEGITIEKYIISQKITRAKKMIQDCHIKLTDIAVIMRYSSVAHFSNQFKQTTGITPSAFKKQVCSEFLQPADD